MMLIYTKIKKFQIKIAFSLERLMIERKPEALYYKKNN